MPKKLAIPVPKDFGSVGFKLQLDPDDLQLGMFTGIASVFGNPIDTWTPTIIEPGAFKKTLKENVERVRILWQHDIWEPIGKPLEMRETEVGLEVVGKLSMTARGKDAIALARDEVITDLSIGFDPIKSNVVETEGEESMRHITELRLWEISFVTWGADSKAKIRDVQTRFRKAVCEVFSLCPNPSEAWNTALTEKPKLLQALRQLIDVHVSHGDVLGDRPSSKLCAIVNDLVTENFAGRSAPAEPTSESLTAWSMREQQLRNVQLLLTQ